MGMTSLVVWMGVAIAVMVVGMAMVLYWVQNKIVYVPVVPGMPDMNPNHFGFHQDAHDYVDTTIPTPDGILLHAWCFPARSSFFNSSSAVNPTMIFFHSNAGNISHRLPYLRGLLNEVGVNVILWDYRGYGSSTGTADERGLRVDGESVMEWVTTSDKAKSLCPWLQGSQLIVFGRSLGGAVASHVAAHPKYSQVISALVLENTFTSIPELIPHVVPMLGRLAPFSSNKWETLKLFEEGRVQQKHVLFISAVHDEMIPHQQMIQLYETAVKVRNSLTTTTTLIKFPVGQHMNLPFQPDYHQKLKEWLTQALTK